MQYSSLLFDRFRKIEGHPVYELAPTLLGRKLNRKEKDHLEQILLNACQTIDVPIWISYPRGIARYNRESWLYQIGFRFQYLPKMIDEMVNLGLLEDVKGHYDRESGIGRFSRFRASSQLSYMLSDAVGLKYSPRCDRVLRARNADGVPISFTESAATCRLRRQIKQINEYQETQDWTLPGADDIGDAALIIGDHEIPYSLVRGGADLSQVIPIAPVHYHRIFSKVRSSKGLWSHHGRWYTRAQNIPSALRPLLRCNGEPTVEIDYVSTHPRMLYQLRGQPVPEEFYVVAGYPVSRNMWKQISLTVINATTEDSAVRALSDARVSDNPFRALPPGITVRQLVRAWVADHSGISDALYKPDNAVTLMYRDATIASRILEELTNQQIPCLGIHDSFVVPASSENVLRAVMANAWRDEIGGEPEVKIKRLLPEGRRGIRNTTPPQTIRVPVELSA